MDHVHGGEEIQGDHGAVGGAITGEKRRRPIDASIEYQQVDGRLCAQRVDERRMCCVVSEIGGDKTRRLASVGERLGQCFATCDVAIDQRDCGGAHACVGVDDGCADAIGSTGHDNVAWRIFWPGGATALQAGEDFGKSLIKRSEQAPRHAREQVRAVRFQLLKNFRGGLIGTVPAGIIELSGGYARALVKIGAHRTEVDTLDAATRGFFDVEILGEAGDERLAGRIDGILRGGRKGGDGADIDPLAHSVCRCKGTGQRDGCYSVHGGHRFDGRARLRIELTIVSKARSIEHQIKLLNAALIEKCLHRRHGGIGRGQITGEIMVIRRMAGR